MLPIAVEDFNASSCASLESNLYLALSLHQQMCFTCTIHNTFYFNTFPKKGCAKKFGELNICLFHKSLVSVPFNADVPLHPAPATLSLIVYLLYLFHPLLRGTSVF
jgi:hypothetical protein